MGGLSGATEYPSGCIAVLRCLLVIRSFFLNVLMNVINCQLPRINDLCRPVQQVASQG